MEERKKVEDKNPKVEDKGANRIRNKLLLDKNCYHETIILYFLMNLFSVENSKDYGFRIILQFKFQTEEIKCLKIITDR